MDEVILSRIRQEAYEQGYQDGKVDGYNLTGTQMSSAKQERKKGKWIFDTEPYPLGNPYGHYGCDQCGEYVPHKANFCPHCGAEMREGGEDE